MSEPLFFCEHIPPAGELARLRGDEAHHATAARRLKQGDLLQLFDGRGTLARARFERVEGHRRDPELALTVQESHQVPPLRPAVHLVAALPKGDRAAVMLDMATQLGMASFTPLRCERSIVDPSGNTLQRLQRVCLEACKQSRRAHVPVVHEPVTLEQALARAGAIWLAHPDGDPIDRVAAAPQTMTILIGPEGGFTDDEIAHASARGAIRVMLGNTILRVETAAVSLLGVAMLATPRA